MARALTGPTGYDSFGIRWREFPALEARGGYSGPFDSQAAAEQRAREFAAAYDEPLTIESVENVNKL